MTLKELIENVDIQKDGDKQLILWSGDGWSLLKLCDDVLFGDDLWFEHSYSPHPKNNIGERRKYALDIIEKLYDNKSIDIRERTALINAILYHFPDEERSKGEWIIDYEGDKNTCTLVTCPFCGERHCCKMNFCGNCGADMRGEENGR